MKLLLAYKFRLKYVHCLLISRLLCAWGQRLWSVTWWHLKFCYHILIILYTFNPNNPFYLQYPLLVQNSLIIQGVNDPNTMSIEDKINCLKCLKAKLKLKFKKILVTYFYNFLDQKSSNCKSTMFLIFEISCFRTIGRMEIVCL